MQDDKKHNKKPKYSALSNALYVLGEIFRTKKSLFFLLTAASLCDSASALIAVYLPKAAVDIVLAAAAGRAVIWLVGLLAALIMVNSVSSMTRRHLQDGAYYDLRMMYLRRIVAKSMSQSYSRLESEEGQNAYWKARDVVLNGDLVGMVQHIVTITANFLNFAAFSFIISQLNPLIVLFVIALSLVTFIFMKRGSRVWESVRDERARVRKQQFILAEDSADARKGKDIRLYGMKELFTEKIRDLADKDRRIYNKQRSGYIEEHYVTIALNFLRDAVAYVYLIYRAADGSMAAGDFVLYFGAIAAFSGWMGGLTWQIDVIRRNYYDICYFRDFLEYEDPKVENPEHIESGGCPEIEFKDVSFSYDGKRDVLTGFNLRIRPGEHIALIGVNGAGKSTIVKLLCGFYAPSSGSVKIGGAEASKVPEEERMKYISAVFQDMCILPHTVAENISMRESGKTDMHRAERSLNEADIPKLVPDLSTPMTRSVSDEGIELSGGESQKLMMARAIYKDAPILILDEPTAALDPIAESETYRRFHELSEGKSALYISHRLAGTRFCDRIVFMDGGRAAEVGTHEELIALGGGYANMFRLQSHYYKEGGEAE